MANELLSASSAVVSEALRTASVAWWLHLCHSSSVAPQTTRRRISTVVAKKAGAGLRDHPTKKGSGSKRGAASQRQSAMCPRCKLQRAEWPFCGVDGTAHVAQNSETAE
mmetsp:Transcript_38304/g.44631  ORF Transcript_38304/g.44631 Transcript_38304/m.44631 type:complete len:109 (-) Transcript_38304:85-411(-)